MEARFSKEEYAIAKKVYDVAFNFFNASCDEQAKAAPVQQTTNARAEICPHYFEATDGVHVVVVGQCRCSGKLSPVA